MPAYHPNHPDRLPDARRPTDTELLMEFASGIMLFRSGEGQAYASLPFGHNSLQVIPIRNPLFWDWVISEFYGRHRVRPQDHPLRKGLRTLNAYALIAAQRPEYPAAGRPPCGSGIRVAFGKSNGKRRVTVAILRPNIDPASQSPQQNQ